MEIKQLEGIIEDANIEAKAAPYRLPRRGVVYTIMQHQKRKRAAKKAVDFFLASMISASLIGASVAGYIHSDYHNNATDESNAEIIQQYFGNSHNKNYQR